MNIRHFTKPYSQADDMRAWASLIPTVMLYVLSLLGAIVFWNSWVLLILFTCLCAIGVIRLYMLQHDCGHFSFFQTRAMNTNVGMWLSMVTCTPIKSLRYNHGLHHQHVGNLDERDASEIYTMTLQEYARAGWWDRVKYRIYRSWITLFVIGPSVIFLLRYRWPKHVMKTGILDAIVTNVLIMAQLSVLIYAFGLPALYIWLSAAILAASMGALIPYIQHNFENVYWERNPDLDFDMAALQGTSVMDFGALFDLCTANIAYHDIHHLNARIPSYRLKECHKDMEHRLSPIRVGLREGLACIQWKLWDEDQGKMVHFPKRKVPILDPQDIEMA